MCVCGVDVFSPFVLICLLQGLYQKLTITNSWQCSSPHNTLLHSNMSLKILLLSVNLFLFVKLWALHMWLLTLKPIVLRYVIEIPSYPLSRVKCQCQQHLTLFLSYLFCSWLYTLGKQEMIPVLKSDLMKYQKGIYMKRRTMATHLLIFMISEELRNKKPYAIPVRIMPVTTVKDLEIRALQMELKTAMEEEDMDVVGEFRGC